MKLVIHRGAREVGGTCVELTYEDTTILLDVGLPLDCDINQEPNSQMPQTLYNQIHNKNKRIDAVLLSHAHLDHYGLIDQLPNEIPIYCGKASASLMRISGLVTTKNMRSIQLYHFWQQKPFKIGSFTITPYLMDHSAFDAYGFLVSAGKKNLFYTGDFRGHGRKGKLLKKLIKHPPEVNAMLMEGTLIGNRTNEKTITENELQNKFTQVFKQTAGIVLISTSSQNIDRLVSIFKATIQSNRCLIIDFYTAEVLHQLKDYAKLPQASWRSIRVCYPRFVSKYFEKLGHQDILEKHRANGIRWTRLNEIENKAVMLIRPGFLYDIKKHLDLNNATWVYSMWPGYFEKSHSLGRLKSYLKKKNVHYEHIHTSGHATLSDLKKLAEAMSPEIIIPIHSYHPNHFKNHFSNVRTVKDGQSIIF